MQQQAAASTGSRVTLLRKLTLECSVCGYGVTRATPPERCPMCQSEGAWNHTPWRPWSRDLTA